MVVVVLYCLTISQKWSTYIEKGWELPGALNFSRMVYGILPFSFLFHPLGHKDQRIPSAGDPDLYALNLSSTNTYVEYRYFLRYWIRVSDWLNRNLLCKNDVTAQLWILQSKHTNGVPCSRLNDGRLKRFNVVDLERKFWELKGENTR